MDSTGKFERFVACGVVVGFHLLLGWLGLRAARIDVVEPAADALQVTWIEARPAPVATPRATTPARVDKTDQAPEQPAIARRPEVAVQPDVAQAIQQADNDTGMAAVFIEQGRQWAAAQAPVDFSAERSLVEWSNPLRGTPPERFRMRRPLNPKAIVDAIGVLMGGADHAAGPCPGIRQNIAALGTGGDALLLQEALRRERAECSR
jgi:hypothetical protein